MAGPMLALGVYLLNPGGHPPEARRLLAIVALVIVWWMSEALPLPATALIVQRIGGVWEDEAGRNWNAFVPYTVLDHDVAEIDGLPAIFLPPLVEPAPRPGAARRGPRRRSGRRCRCRSGSRDRRRRAGCRSATW